jgi:phenylalanyl-tRNA synthetase beta chain
VSFSLGEVRRHLGPTEDAEGITAATAEGVLTGLGCGLASAASESWSVTLPSWRLDLEREIDLIEEIARVYGYNQFRNTLPSFAGTVVELPWAEKEATVRRTLLALGWNEAISSSFCGAEDAARFVREPGSTVAIGNPLSEEAGMLRPSLLPGMLEAVALNLSRDVEGIALFEMGTVFSGGPERVDERPSLGMGATGSAFGPHEANFYDVKGTVEELLGKCASRSMYFDHFPAASGLMPSWLHPGRSARAVLDGATAGWFGQLHPAEAERRKLKQTIWIGELWLDRLYKQGLRQPVVEELSRYQPVRRDFSVILPDSVAYANVADALEGQAIPELRSFEPKEVLRGKLAPVGHYSLLLRVVFQSHERTLREEEVQSWSQQVITALESVGGKLRA